MSPGKSNPSFPCCWNTIIPSLSKCATDHNIGFGKCEFINILITLAISEVDKTIKISSLIKLYFISNCQNLIFIMKNSKRSNDFNGNKSARVLATPPGQDVQNRRCNKCPYKEHQPGYICQWRCKCVIIVRS